MNKKNEKDKKSKRGQITVVLAIVGIFAFISLIYFMAFVFGILGEKEWFVIVAIVPFSIIPLGIVYGIIKAAKNRIKEIEEEDKNDYSNY